MRFVNVKIERERETRSIESTKRRKKLEINMVIDIFGLNERIQNEIDTASILTLALNSTQNTLVMTIVMPTTIFTTIIHGI